MSHGRDYSKIVEAARSHYQNIKTDIVNAKDRIEHIRLTALAQEAHNLLTDLVAFEAGLVYSHTNNVDGYVFSTAGIAVTGEHGEEPLDLPEFKSPYTPPMG
jgi:hypothetical protein